MDSGDSTAVLISALRPGQQVEGVFACSRKDRLLTRSGSPYLALELRDRSGTIQARAFQDADALAGRFERGELAHVSGRVERFRDQPVLEVVSIARLEPRASGGPGAGGGPSGGGGPGAGPGPDPADFLPTAYRDLDELEGFFEHLAGEVHDRGFRAFLEAVLADRELRAGLRRAPCTRAGHHAYLGGLLEHTVAVATLAYEVCQLHPRLNQDLLLTAALVHDLGRTREFTYGAEIGLTDEGRLLGHLVIGSQLVSSRAGALDEQRRLALLHCLLSHHGAAAAPGGRFGSVEALTLYRVNALDAGIKGAIDHGLGIETAARSDAQ